MDGVDEARLAGGLRLSAQVTHVHLEGVGRGLGAVAPDAIEDELAGEDPTRVSEHELQQEELCRGQPDEAVAPVRLAGVDVEGQICEAEDLARSRCSPKESAHAGEELV